MSGLESESVISPAIIARTLNQRKRACPTPPLARHPAHGRRSACRASGLLEIALPPPICSAFHKRPSGSASLLPHERVIRSRLRSPSLSNGNSPLRRNRRSGSRHIPQSPCFRQNPNRVAAGAVRLKSTNRLHHSYLSA